MTPILTGKKILVTGATGAIGSAVLESALQAGAWVAGSYFQDESQSLRLKGLGARLFQADLTDRKQAQALVEKVLQEAGHLDALVYSAGNTRDHTLMKLSDPEWDEVLSLHLTGLMACCRAVLPAMRVRRSGKLAAIGSVSGAVGRAGQSNYAAAKAATVGFMKSLAKEAGRFGVSANVVLPGFVDSKMTRLAPPEAWERAKAESALGTIGSARVAASFVTWLLSDGCSGVTGQVFNLDSRIV
ncbi:MAG: SDR family oxidoreductase [Candidatus Omnitrophica bacterium]|nr:SDR family oxidoreductase [Candidatus Omnitrophota bacterium]